MGNIRSDDIKNVCKRIYEMYPDKITTDFETNKIFVSQITDANKKARNRIAGYLTVMKNNSNRIITAPKKQKKIKSKNDVVKKQFRKWV
jgi:ribosomal protein S17E